MNDEEYITKIAEFMDNLAKLADKTNCLDVIIPACASILASFAAAREGYSKEDSLMFYIAYSNIGPALISIDHDVTPFLEACDNLGIQGVDYFVPIYLDKKVDIDEDKGDNPPNKETIH